MRGKERFMTSFDFAEFTVRKIHERRTREALGANEIAHDPRNKNIAKLEKDIKLAADILLDNKDGQREIVIGQAEASELLSKSPDGTARTWNDGAVIKISREMPERRITIRPLNPQDLQHTEVLALSDLHPDTDNTLLARHEIKAARSGVQLDTLDQKLSILNRWQLIVSALVERYSPSVAAPAPKEFAMAS